MLLLCVFVFVCVSICHMCVGTREGQKCQIPRCVQVNQHEFWAPNLGLLQELQMILSTTKQSLYSCIT